MFLEQKILVDTEMLNEIAQSDKILSNELAKSAVDLLTNQETVRKKPLCDYNEEPLNCVEEGQKIDQNFLTKLLQNEWPLTDELLTAISSLEVPIN